jgi:hypothetical protein
MADVTINQLPTGSLTASSEIPFTNGTNTSKATILNVSNIIGSTLGVTGTGALRLPSGTTAQRPSPPLTGMIRFNTTTNKIEAYNGTNWGNINIDFGPYSVEALIVAGGGGSGSGGGGGGGGVIPWQTLTLGSFEVIQVRVGAGGAGGKNNGGNSYFGNNSSTTAIGGGGGAIYLDSGSDGGSGGGAGERGSPGRGTPGQGNNGGPGRTGGYPYSGGCGGGYATAGGGYGGVGGTGYTLDNFVKQIPPFSNFPGGVPTHVSSGGGYRSAHPQAVVGEGGPGAGGSGNNNARWYGCGGANSGSGFQGIVVIRYSGTQRASGGVTTYNANDNKTYHAFTNVGDNTLYSN